MPPRFEKPCRPSMTDRASEAIQRMSQDGMTQSRKYATSLPNARMEKVAAVKIAIENGCYSVSSADLAQKLMSNMLGHFQ